MPRNCAEESVRVRLLSLVLVLCIMPTTAKGQATGSVPPRPNILFAIADDWSYGHAGAYGCSWVKTPAFDRLAENGLLFTRAYTPNAKCAPSRACILTGRNSWQLEEAANHICFFPPTYKTYAEALTEKGYFVGVTGKGWGPGVATDAAGKRRKMAGRPFNEHTLNPPARFISSNDYARNFEAFLDEVPAGKPWCFWLGSLEPHRGYEYGVGVRRGGKKPGDIDRVPGFWPDNDVVRNDMLDYAFEVEHFDRHVGRAVDTITKRGLKEDTLIVATSDHGMPFPRAKGQAYDYSNHIPLAISWPRGIRNPGRVIGDYVSFIDLAPTFIDVAGLSWPETGMRATAGHSLTDIFRSQESGRIMAGRDRVLIGKERHDVGRPHDWGYPIRGIIKDDMIYVKNFEITRWPAGNPETGYLNCDGSPTKTEVLTSRLEPERKVYWDRCFGKRPPEELYNTATDPDCCENLASSGDFGGRKEALEEQLMRELRAQGDPRVFGKGDVFDRYIYADTGTRGFYERFMSGEKLRAGWVNATDFEKAPIGE